MTRRSVAEDLARAIPATLELTLASLLLSVVVGGALGVLAALRRGGIADTLATAVPVAQLSIPVFVLGLLLLLVFTDPGGFRSVDGRSFADSAHHRPHTVDAILQGGWKAFRARCSISSPPSRCRT
jgi:ABC-type dipeptide/oligopeptide/nickel transport system permease component